MLVVDDHPLMLNGLRILVGSLGLGFHIETCRSAEVGLARAETFTDLRLIILDYALPILSGVQAVEAFRQRYPEVPLIVLSGSEDQRTGERVIDAGAMAFVSKTEKPEVLVALIIRALQSAKSAARQKSRARPEAGAVLPQAPTKRQCQVLQCLMYGQSNKEIAIQLKIAEITVKTHVAALMRRFGVSNRTQVLIEAQRRGLLPVSGHPDDVPAAVAAANGDFPRKGG